jgi:hypothetical protein
MTANIALADRLQTCIDELIAIQFDPAYRQDWEDLQTNLGDVLVNLQILLDSMKDLPEVNDDH